MLKVFFKHSPQKRHLRDIQRQILHLGGSQKMYLTFLVWPPLKSRLKRVVIAHPQTHTVQGF